jgi:hypothetical protein
MLYFPDPEGRFSVRLSAVEPDNYLQRASPRRYKVVGPSIATGRQLSTSVVLPSPIHAQ